MKRHLALWLTLATIIVGGSLLAQTAHIGEQYGFSWNNHAEDLSDKYTTAEAVSKFHNWYEWMLFNGYTPADFMASAEGVAAHNDFVWRHHAAGYGATCQSRANVIWPHGKFNIDFKLFAGFGHYSGQGSSKFYSAGTIAQGGTELWLDHDNWLGDPAVRNLFESGTWGQQDVYGYHEAVIIEDFRLNGNWHQLNDPAIQSSGIALWDMGEVSLVQNCYADNWNTDGFTFARGTPVTVINCSAFHNKRFGFGSLGGALASYRMFGISGDNNGLSLCGALPGAGRVSGGLWILNGVKMESYGYPNVFNKAADGMILFYGEGYLTLEVTGVTIGNHNIYTDAMIVLRNLHQNHSTVAVNSMVSAQIPDSLYQDTMVSTVNFHGMRGYEYMNVLQIEGERFDIADKNYGGVTFDWSSRYGFNSNVPWSVSEGSNNLLWYLDRDPWTGQPVGSFDYVNGTPERVWQIDGEQPACVWTCTAWGECANGQRERTCSSSGDCGGVPSPPTVQTCASVPIEGCTDPACSNYNPEATIDNGSCTGCEVEPPPTYITAFQFNDADPKFLKGDPIDATMAASWGSMGKISNGQMVISGTNVKYSTSIPGATSMVLHGVTFNGFTHGYLCNGVQITPEGFVQIDGAVTTQRVQDGTVTIYFPLRTITTLFNGAGGIWNSQKMTVDAVEFY